MFGTPTKSFVARRERLVSHGNQRKDWFRYSPVNRAHPSSRARSARTCPATRSPRLVVFAQARPHRGPGHRRHRRKTLAACCTDGVRCSFPRWRQDQQLQSASANFVAERAKSAGVDEVVFDDGGYRYHRRSLRSRMRLAKPDSRSNPIDLVNEGRRTHGCTAPGAPSKVGVVLRRATTSSAWSQSTASQRWSRVVADSASPHSLWLATATPGWRRLWQGQEVPAPSPRGVGKRRTSSAFHGSGTIPHPVTGEKATGVVLFAPGIAWYRSYRWWTGALCSSALAFTMS